MKESNTNLLLFFAVVENTSGEPSYGPGWLSRPGARLPAGTWVGVSARMYNDSNSLGDRANCKEDHGSEHMHAGTGEGISARTHVENSHGDSVEEGRRSYRKHSANSLWERDDFCMLVGASIVVAYVGVGGRLFNLTLASAVVQPIPLGVTFSNTVSKAQERLFSLKRGKRDLRALIFELSKMSPQVGLAVIKSEEEVICWCLFFFWKAATQIARQVHQERTLFWVLFMPTHSWRINYSTLVCSIKGRPCLI